MNKDYTLADLYCFSVFWVCEEEGSWEAHSLTASRSLSYTLEELFTFDYEIVGLVFNSQKSIDRFLADDRPALENIRKYVRLMRTSANQPFVVTASELRSGLEAWFPGCTETTSGDPLNDAKKLISTKLVSDVRRPQPPRFLALETRPPIHPSWTGIELLMFNALECLSRLDDAAKVASNNPHSFPVSTAVGMKTREDRTGVYVIVLQDRVEGALNDVVLVSNAQDPNRTQWPMRLSGRKLFSTFGTGLPKLGRFEIVNVQWDTVPVGFRGWTPRSYANRVAPVDVLFAAS